MFSKKNNDSSRSLSVRLTLNFTTLLVVSHLFFLLAVAYTLKSELAEKDRNLVHSRQHEFASILSTEGIEKLKQDFANETDRKVNYHLLIKVLSPDGEVLFERLPERLKNFNIDSIHKKLDEAFESYGYYTINPRIYGEETIELLSERVEDKYILISGLCTEESEDFMGTFIKSAILIALSSILLSVLMGYFYARNALLPIRSLISIIKEIQSGKRRSLVPQGKANDELSDLIDLFNKMTSEINQLIDSLQFSLDSIAHDLRTPMTHLSLRFEKEIAREDQQVNKDFLHECLEEVQAISHTLTSLLEITEADSGSYRIEKETFDIRRLLDECVELYEYIAEAKQAQIHISAKALFINADRNLLRRVIANLIDNALKYSDKNVTIDINAYEDDQYFMIQVSDNGWGIKKEDQTKIWQRLYRGDESRSTQGLGLGLSFIKPVIERHGGQVSVDSKPDEGSTFTIKLPKNTNAPNEGIFS